MLTNGAGVKGEHGNIIKDPAFLIYVDRIEGPTHVLLSQTTDATFLAVP